MIDLLDVRIFLKRKGTPGAEWTGLAVVYDWTKSYRGRKPEGERIESGPLSSPGEVLEELARELDKREADAIVKARKPAELGSKPIADRCRELGLPILGHADSISCPDGGVVVKVRVDSRKLQPLRDEGYRICATGPERSIVEPPA